MKKYKLIKWYPSLPKGIKEGDKVKKDWTAFGDKYIAEGKGVIDSLEEVENNPEFWEEVVEKNYRILRVTPSRGIMIHKNKKVDYKEKFRLGDCWDIYSVKRLSDGEVFIVGDTVKNQFGVYTITKFKEGELGKGKLIVHTDGNNAYLSETEHYKKALFTTEDGVNIYEGDEYYAVNLEHGTQPVWSVADENSITTTWKKFQTKRNAEEYIEQNKPKYSLKEIKEAFAVSSIKDVGTIERVDKKIFYSRLCNKFENLK